MSKRGNDLIVGALDSGFIKRINTNMYHSKPKRFSTISKNPIYIKFDLPFKEEDQTRVYIFDIYNSKSKEFIQLFALNKEDERKIIHKIFELFQTNSKETIIFDNDSTTIIRYFLRRFSEEKLNYEKLNFKSRCFVPPPGYDNGRIECLGLNLKSRMQIVNNNIRRVLFLENKSDIKFHKEYQNILEDSKNNLLTLSFAVVALDDKSLKKTEGEKFKEGLKLLDLKMKSGRLTANEIIKEIRKINEQIIILKDAYNKASK